MKVTPTTREQATRFAIIGGIGFVVDGGILTVLNSLFGLNPLLARALSFPIAVTVTWYLNRHRTFSERKSRRAAFEWSRYAALNGIGALLNLGVFFWLINRFNTLADTPLLPLAMGASIALVFNFLTAKHLVFRHQQT